MPSRSNVRLWIVAAALVVLVLFLLQNMVTVQIRFLLWEWSVPRAVLVLVLFAAGVVVGWLLRAIR